VHKKVALLFSRGNLLSERSEFQISLGFLPTFSSMEKVGACPAQGRDSENQGFMISSIEI